MSECATIIRMAHLTQEELARELAQAAALVEKNARYVHFKDQSREYIVRGFAIREDTQEACVIYEAQYEERIPFIRTLASFTETVEYNGQSVLRFQRIS